jgi:hypothetical protein
MQPSYPLAIEQQMQDMFGRLSEKDKRLYAGVEGLKFAYGGISYIAQLFACSRNTILRGIIELGGKETIPRNRDRKSGGGRKQVMEKQADINEVFLSVLKEHTAGVPMDEKVKWTNLTKADIAELAKKGFKVSRNIVKKWLKNHDYVKRKPSKSLFQ